jgi:two-component system nitrate/nitrite response regulator NarL
MLTVSEDEQDLAAALRAGARGYLLKTVDSEMLAQSIVRAVRGESVISAEMTGKLVAAFQSAAQPPAPADPDAASSSTEPAPAGPLDSLSPREREILQGIARGQSNKEIARDLGIAETTVKIHVQHILRKLGLASRVQAAVFAAQQGNAT